MCLSAFAACFAISCQQEPAAPIAGSTEKEIEQQAADKDAWWEESKSETDELIYTTSQYEAEGVYMEDLPSVETVSTSSNTNTSTPTSTSSSSEPGFEGAVGTDGQQVGKQINLYAGCGFTQTAASNSSTQLFGANLRSTLSKLSGRNTISWVVTATSDMAISAAVGQSEISMSFDVVDGTPSRAKAKAESNVAKYANDTTFKSVSNEKIQNLLGRGAQNPACGILMANRVEVKSNGGATYINADFSKPFPYLLSTTLSASRALRELAEPIVIDNIKATVKSNDPEVTQGGASRTGKVSINLINPKRTITDSNGKSTTFEAEYAYRVSSKFDGASSVWWLDQISDYYVKNGEIIGTVVQIPKNEIKVIVYKK